MGVAALQAAQTQQIEQPGHPGGVLAAAQAEAGVAPGIEMGEEGIVLEDHADAPPLGGQQAIRARHRASADADGAAAGALEAGDQAQQGGLAATGGPQQPHQLAGPEDEVDPLEGPGGDVAARVAVPEVIDADVGAGAGDIPGGDGRGGGGGRRDDGVGVGHKIPVPHFYPS